MSTATAFAIGISAPLDGPVKRLGGLRVRLRSKFYRFLHELPEGYEPVDPEVLKRVPVPI